MTHSILLIIVSLISLNIDARPAIDMPTTNLSSGLWINPKINGLKNGPIFTIFSLNTEVAIYPYLNGGVQFEMAFDLSRTTGYWIVSDLSPYLKPQMPFDTEAGRFTLYSKLSMGPTLSIEKNKTVLSQAISGKIPYPINLGAHMTGVGGIEYFPIPPLGFYVEGGYRTNWVWQRSNDQHGQHAESIFIHGWLAIAGVRVCL